ncbi:FMN-binding protein [uncultured Anaerococcus sp.]|uniref:FMN-binding protein n=1 Tax=uncultured Anaerococcus sp. TaxID=293428 RepID=UPI002639F9E6|nr:FMN-binding protein [uncultured Anaerococcus sp.]
MKNLKKYTLVLASVALLGACGNDNADTANTTGTGEATGSGYGGDINVTVNLEEGKIKSIDTDHTETEGIGADAIPELTDEIIKNNGTEGVDNVSGATVTSEAFKSVVDEAVKNAK